jgi:hypothetical protein
VEEKSVSIDEDMIEEQQIEEDEGEHDEDEKVEVDLNSGDDRGGATS